MRKKRPRSWRKQKPEEMLMRLTLMIAETTFQRQFILGHTQCTCTLKIRLTSVERALKEDMACWLHTADASILECKCRVYFFSMLHSSKIRLSCFIVNARINIGITASKPLKLNWSVLCMSLEQFHDKIMAWFKRYGSYTYNIVILWLCRHM